MPIAAPLGFRTPATLAGKKKRKKTPAKRKPKPKPTKRVSRWGPSLTKAQKARVKRTERVRIRLTKLAAKAAKKSNRCPKGTRVHRLKSGSVCRAPNTPLAAAEGFGEGHWQRGRDGVTAYEVQRLARWVKKKGAPPVRIHDDFLDDSDDAGQLNAQQREEHLGPLLRHLRTAVQRRNQGF